MKLDAVVHMHDHEGRLIEEIAGAPASREMSMSKDAYKELIGDGNASVRISVSEKIGGPYGFSSVGLDVSVILRCDQSVEGIAAAQKAAYDECIGFMDLTLANTYKMLKDHLESHFTKEE